MIKKIKLYVEDSETDVEEGIKAAKKLISINKVIAIYGPCSDVIIGILDLCADNKVPVISGVAGTSRLDKISGKYQYRTAASDSFEGLVDATFIYEELGLKNVSVIAADDEGPSSIARNFKEAYEKLGGKILEYIVVSSGQATYMSSVQLAFEPKPELVLLSAGIDMGVAVIKEWKRSGYGGKIFLGSDLNSRDFIDLVGVETIEGMYCTTPDYDPNSVSYQAFKTKFKAITGREYAECVPNCYDAMILLGLAIQAAGEATGKGIAENMQKVANPPGVKVYSFAEGKEQLLLGNDIDYEGASGPCDFNEYGNVEGGKSQYIYNNGKAVLIKYYPGGSIKLE